MFDQLPPEVALFICAELMFFVTSSRRFLVAIKSKAQRTADEQRQIDRGLRRSLAFESLALVPASAVLVSLGVPALIQKLNLQGMPKTALYSLAGMVSYGFPFGAIKKAVVGVALDTLKQFASSVAAKLPPPETDKLPPPDSDK
jgi:hypothetical protein